MFTSDLQLGEMWEHRLMAVLPLYGYQNPKKMDGYFKDYDIHTSHGTFEVKYDRKQEQTGNLFFEIRYGTELSGIACTKADYFVVIINSVAIVTRVICARTFLKEMVGAGVARLKSGCGDDGKTTGIIVPQAYYCPQYVEGMNMWIL